MISKASGEGLPSNQVGVQIHKKISEQSNNSSVCTNKLVKLFKKIKFRNLVKRLISQTKSRMYKNLKEIHFRLINDQSCLEAYASDAIILKAADQKQASWLRLIILLIQQIPVFEPSSNLRLFWDILQLCAISIFVFFIPIHLTFNLELNQLGSSHLTESCSLLILFDFLVSLNTGFFYKGRRITNRYHIFKHYLQTSVLDLVGLVSVFQFYILQQYLQLDDTFTRIIKLCFILKVSNFSKITKRLEERFLLGPKLNNTIKFLKLLLTIILITHLCSCIWVFIALRQEASGLSSWIDSKKLNREDWYLQYCSSYYFITVTIATVGYGDIAPTNSLEQIFCIVLIAIGSGVFGYSLNTVGMIVQDFQKIENEIKRKMTIINNYLHSKSINKDLQYHIREYLDYYWKEIGSRDKDEEEKIINQLPEALKQHLLLQANKIIVQDSPIFSKNFSNQVVSKTIALIEEVRTTPEQIIFLKDDYDDGSIYFIEKGSVELYIDTGGDESYQQIKVIKKGSSFGAVSFFTSQPRNCNVRSLEFTTLLKIKRQSFQDLLKAFPDDQEMYCHIKDQIMLNSQYDRAGSRCLSCSSTCHPIFDCPYLHLVSDKIKVILKYNYSSDQYRYYQERFPTKKVNTNAKANFLKTILALKKYNDTNERFLDNYEEKYLCNDYQITTLQELDTEPNNVNEIQQQELNNSSISIPQLEQQQLSNQLSQEQPSPFLQDSRNNLDKPSQSDKNLSMSTESLDKYEEQNQPRQRDLLLEEVGFCNIIVNQTQPQFQTQMQQFNERRQSIQQIQINQISQAFEIQRLQNELKKKNQNNPKLSLNSHGKNIYKRVSTYSTAGGGGLGEPPNRDAGSQMGQPKVSFSSQSNLFLRFETDEMKIFNKYMPWNNYTNVIQLVNEPKANFKIKLDQFKKSFNTMEAANRACTHKNRTHTQKQQPQSSNKQFQSFFKDDQKSILQQEIKLNNNNSGGLGGGGGGYSGNSGGGRGSGDSGVGGEFKDKSDLIINLNNEVVLTGNNKVDIGEKKESPQTTNNKKKKNHQKLSFQQLSNQIIIDYQSRKNSNSNIKENSNNQSFSWDLNQNESLQKIIHPSSQLGIDQIESKEKEAHSCITVNNINDEEQLPNPPKKISSSGQSNSNNNTSVQFKPLSTPPLKPTSIIEEPQSENIQTFNQLGSPISVESDIKNKEIKYFSKSASRNVPIKSDNKL